MFTSHDLFVLSNNTFDSTFVPSDVDFYTIVSCTYNFNISVIFYKTDYYLNLCSLFFLFFG